MSIYHFYKLHVDFVLTLFTVKSLNFHTTPMVLIDTRKSLSLLNEFSDSTDECSDTSINCIYFNHNYISKIKDG